MAELIFCFSFSVVFFAYFGYWLFLRFVGRKRPTSTGQIFPTVSIVLAAKNEAHHLAAKLENLQQLQYPRELIQTIIVSDGSTDETAAMLARHPDVCAIFLEKSVGKSLALNEGLACASGELVLFLDARQRLDKDALAKLVECMSDPSVGAVSGELVLEKEDGSPTDEALGIYWKIEKSVRRLESESGSVVGVTGAIYLIRRHLFISLPAGLILDDVMVPMNIARQGYRVLFQPSAIARDRLFGAPGKEFRRKVRTLTGNFQMLRLAPWLLSSGNPLLFRFVSHKVLRLLAPLLLSMMLLSSAVSRSPFLRFAFVAQLVFFGLALVGKLSVDTRRWRLVSIPYTFVLLNAAATVAFYKFLMRRSVWD